MLEFNEGGWLDQPIEVRHGLLSHLPSPGPRRNEEQAMEDGFIHATYAVGQARTSPSKFFTVEDSQPQEPGIPLDAVKDAYFLQQEITEGTWWYWPSLVDHMIRVGLVEVTVWEQRKDSIRPEGFRMDPARIQLTERGHWQLWKVVSPRVSPQEGGYRHIVGLQRLYRGLAGSVPAALVAPRQGNRSAADLVCRVPTRGPGVKFFATLDAGSLVELQVETSTMHSPRRRQANLMNPWRRRSYPIMVIPCALADSAKRARHFHQLLRKDLGLEKGYPLPDCASWAVLQWRRPFTVWTVSMDTEAPVLQAYQPQADAVHDVRMGGAFGAMLPGPAGRW
jgi:hypothetical protein